MDNPVTQTSLPAERFDLRHPCHTKGRELAVISFPGGSEVKASASDAGDPASIPGPGKSPGEGNGNPIQYSFLENPLDGEAW